MNRDEAIAIIRKEYLCVDRDCDIDRSCGKCDLMMPSKEPILEAYKMAIKALEQEPCEDVIDRAEAMTEIMMFAGNVKSDEEDIYIKVSDTVQLLRELPSITPQPKTGHWEWVQYDYNPKFGNWHCSECRCVVVECVGKEEKGGIPLYKCCPQCGAKMVEPQESNDKCKNCEYSHNPDYTRCHECRAESEG